MDVEEKILARIRMQGPVLPADIAKVIETNILLASAYLSELVSRKKLRMSTLKVGGSPLYYIVGQEQKLERFSENLNEKDFRAFEVLKERRVLRDSELTPLMRVSLRNIKDFAVPLTVTFKDAQELFWKWHVASDEEVNQNIRKELGLDKQEEKPEEEEKEAIQESVASKKEEVSKEIEEKVVLEKPEIKEKEIVSKKEVVKKKKKVEKKKTVKKEKKKKVQPKKPLKKRKEKIKQEVLTKKDKKVVEKEEVKVDFDEADLKVKIKRFFDEKDIRILEEEVIRKNSEINYVIEIPSAMGHLQYLCKVQNKKRSTEKDISGALVEGQLKKMPVVFLHAGVLNAKAKELAATETFKTMVFYQLEDGSKAKRSHTEKRDYF